jgi:SCY1-like protein 3
VGLFSLPIYRVYVVPCLLQMFCVRDAQVRLLLLTHFSSYCSSFTEDQLRTLVLPEASCTMLEFCCYICIYVLISNSGINVCLNASLYIMGRTGNIIDVLAIKYYARVAH